MKQLTICRDKNMAKTLTFNSPETYSICFSALALAQHQLQPSTWDLHITCLRALRSIGKPTVKLPGGVQLYDLDLDNGMQSRELSLDNVEFDYLISCVEQPMWNAGVIEQVVETRDWLKAIKHDKPHLEAVK